MGGRDFWLAVGLATDTHGHVRLLALCTSSGAWVVILAEPEVSLFLLDLGSEQLGLWYSGHLYNVVEELGI